VPSARAAENRVEFLPEFGRPVRIAEFERPGRGDDEETAQTIAYMDELAAADAGQRCVVEAVNDALGAADLDLNSDPYKIACAIFWWLKKTITYVDTPGTSPLVDQTLITPAAILAMPDPIGDCPQFSMLAAAMFRVCCIPCYFVTIAAERTDPAQYSHVYNTIEVSPGVFLPFDSSNGPEPGAEYARPYKRRVWSRITPDKCSNRRKGSTPMMRTSYAASRAARSGWRNRQLRGALGDTVCDSEGDCYDTSSGDQTAYAPGSAAGPQAPAPPPITYYAGPSASQLPTIDPSTGNILAPGPAISPTNASGGPSGGFLTTLINDAAAVAAPLVKAATQQAPYYVTNPQTGQSVLYNPNTGAVAGAGIGSPGTINPTYLLIGAALIGVLALAGKK
jgi:hypothetical protein